MLAVGFVKFDAARTECEEEDVYQMPLMVNHVQAGMLFCFMLLYIIGSYTHGLLYV